MNATYTALIALLRSGDVLPAISRDESLVTNNQFSMRIRSESKAFLDAQAGRLGISKASLYGMLLEGVIAEARGTTADRMTWVYERFCLLMDAHGLTTMEQAQLLAPFGIRAGALASIERTLDLLGLPVLQQMATWFDIDVNWLLGESPYPLDMHDGTHDWVAQYPSIICRLQGQKRATVTGTPELIFYRQAGREAAFTVGVCVRSWPLIHGVALPSLRLYQPAVWEDPEVNAAYRQLLETLSADIDDQRVVVRYLTFTTRQIQALQCGEVLPSLIIDSPVQQYKNAALWLRRLNI